MKSHIIEIDHSVEVPEDGLLLGNGDLSCSFLQRPGCLVWRLGKGDVWDRRVAYELDPKPAHIDETHPRQSATNAGAAAPTAAKSRH